MTSGRTVAGTTVLFGAVALGHAALTWPLEATLALFVGGALLAFFGEAIVVALDLLEHHVGPNVLGVPLYVLAGWTAVIYVALRIALLVTTGLAVVLLTAAIATGYDVLTDNRGVADGHWTYSDEVAGPRHREVPWWNYAGWFVISAATASLAVVLL